MKLTDVEVSRPQIDHTIQVASYFGTRRVVYEIPREPLDDYFPRRPHLTDTERHTLVNSNLKGITTVMQQKMRAGGLAGDQSRQGDVLAAGLQSA